MSALGFGDVVEFALDGGEARVGAINEEGLLQELGRREGVEADEEDEGDAGVVTLFFDLDAQHELEALEVLRVLEDAWMEQRAVEDRVLNPHGEIAEDVFFVPRRALQARTKVLDE